MILSYFLFVCFVVFFFNDTATTEIYTLSLHDALPIFIQVLEARNEASVVIVKPSLTKISRVFHFPVMFG